MSVIVFLTYIVLNIAVNIVVCSRTNDMVYKQVADSEQTEQNQFECGKLKLL